MQTTDYRRFKYIYRVISIHYRVLTNKTGLFRLIAVKLGTLVCLYITLVRLNITTVRLNITPVRLNITPVSLHITQVSQDNALVSLFTVSSQRWKW